MPIPERFKDKDLYKFVETEAKAKGFLSDQYSLQYRNKWIEKRYEKLGGKFKGEKSDDFQGVPENVADRELYKFVMREAETRPESSLTRNEWIRNRYRELGGRFDKSKGGVSEIEKETDDVPDNVKNPALYLKAKNEADDKFKEKTSAYKSMFIVKRYKELGGEYSTKKSGKGETTRWLKEKWVQVIPFVTRNQEIECGSAVREKKACRPLKKIDKKTPMTMKEIVDKHGKKKVVELAKQKNEDMKGRLDWGKGSFKKSK